MAPTPSLNVALTPHLEHFIQALLSSGRYQTASEVVRAGLRLLEKFEATDAPLTGAGPIDMRPAPASRVRKNPAESKGRRGG